MTAESSGSGDVESRIEGLSATRRELLARLQHKAHAGTAPGAASRQAPPPVRPRERRPSVPAPGVLASGPTAPGPRVGAAATDFDQRARELPPSRQALLRALQKRRAAAGPAPTVPPRSGSPLVPLQPDGRREPLVCVHAISGSVFVYMALSGELGPDQPLFGIEAPGFDGSSAPVACLEELASRYRQAIDVSFGARPVTLMGWSMGGVVAYEIARQRWERTGAMIPLILVDAWVPDGQPLPGDDETLRYYVRELTSLHRGTSGPPPSPQDPVPAVPFDELIDRLRGDGALPADLDTGVARHRYALLRANIRALHAYVPPRTYPGPLTQVIAAREDRTLDGWARLAGAVPADTRVVPGDHHSIWDRAHLGELGEVIRSVLRARRPPAGASDRDD